MHFPDKRLVAEAFARGDLPEWNPHGGLGYPLVGGAVDAVLHPFNALLVLLPFEAGFKAWTLLSFLLAAMGTFAWLRQLGAGFPAAVGGGLALALTGFLVGSTDNHAYLTAAATAPLVLAAGHAFVARGGLLRIAAVGLASGLAAAAGDPQGWGLTVLALPACALLVERPGVGRAALALRGLGAVGAATVGAAPFLAPVLAWLPDSSRGDALAGVELERYNLAPLRALELALPGLFQPERLGATSSLYQAYAAGDQTSVPWVASEYLGISVLAFAALALARSRRAAVLVAGAAAFAWMAMGSHAGFGAIARHLPVISGFRYWEKVAFFTALLAVAAGALGLDAWIRGGGSRRFARGAGLAAALLLGAFALGQLAPGAALRLVARERRPAESAQFAANLSAGLLHAGVVCLGLAVLAAAAARGRLTPRARAVAGVALVAVDLAAANASAYVLLPSSIARPPSALAAALGREPGRHRVVTPFRFDEEEVPLGAAPAEWVAARAAASLHSGWNVAYGIGNFEAYTGLLPARAMRFRLRSRFGAQLPMPGLWGVAFAVVPDRTERAAEVGLPPPYEVVLSDPATGALLLRLPHRPRAYLADEVESVDRRAAMEFAMRPGSVGERRTVVEGPAPAGYRPPRGEARLVGDRPERVELRTEADGPALLVLNDTLAPGWRATVDGAPAEILPANYLARGVWVPAGVHAVVFTYRTPGLALGIAVALAGAAALAATAAVRARRARPALPRVPA
jgi:hypothetical protein